MVPSQVTVFGGSGFIGRHVVKRLAGAGCRIVVAVRDPERARVCMPMGNVGQIMPVFCDVRDETLVARAVQGSEAVVNLVGILWERGKSRFDAIHGAAPGVIGRAARAEGAETLVHISALGADADSESHYARSKAAGEAAVREAFPEATVMRPSVVFGPEDDFFNRFAAVLRLTPVFPLFGGGHNRFQPVYVGDVAEAVLQALSRRVMQGKTFELGGPRVYTFREILELILEETERDRILMPVPYGAARLLGVLGDMVATLGIEPPLTSDQARLLKSDNVLSGESGLAALGIEPTGAEAIIPTYLDRFRPTGRFRAQAS